MIYWSNIWDHHHGIEYDRMDWLICIRIVTIYPMIQSIKVSYQIWCIVLDLRFVDDLVCFPGSLLQLGNRLRVYIYINLYTICFFV